MHIPLITTLAPDGPRRLGNLVKATVCAFVIASLSVPAEAQTAAWPTEFRLHEMLAYHIVNNSGEAFTVSLHWQNETQAEMESPLLVRVLGPGEQTLVRQEIPGPKVPGFPGWNDVDVQVPAAGAGVYQVLLTSFRAKVQLSVSPDLPWGLFAYPELESQTPNYSAYIYLPPGLSQLPVRVTGNVTFLRLSDASDIVHMNLTGANPQTTVPLPPGNDRIWRLTSEASLPFCVNFGGMPIIICPDAATAQAIHASVDVLADGTICFHKFQQAAHDALAIYRAMPASAFTVTPPNMGASMDQWLAEPTRNYLLVGPGGVFSGLAITLSSQNLNPASPWFGSTRVWLNDQGMERPENPWATYDRLRMEQVAPLTSLLAAVYSADTPVNPLHHDANLRNRIIIGALQDLMMIREHELPNPEYTYYDGGEKAFLFSRFMRAYPWVIADCPGDVQAAWTEGMRRCADHMNVTCVPDLINQWSFVIKGLQHFADGSGEQIYRDVVARHISWLLSRSQQGGGRMPAGYFSEQDGPDASYSGIQLHNLSLVAELSGNVPLKNAIKSDFELLCHAVAPEPDGSWLGTSSYCHRRPECWTQPNSAAGVGMMADESPEASAMLGHVWFPARPPRNAAELAQAQQLLQWHMVYLTDAAWNDPTIGLTTLMGNPDLQFAVWEHFASPPISGAQLPVKADDRFTRKFADEFFCVRKPSYYAILYVAKRLQGWHQQFAPDDPNAQYPRNGGGLSLLWSPKLGSSVLAQNWSAFATNGIISKKGSTLRFENYWQTDAGLQEAQSRATINGKLTGGKLIFRRQLNFLEDRITCEIRLQSTQAQTFDRLWEVFPYPLNKPDELHVSFYDEDGHKIAGNNKLASAIVFHNHANEVHVIAFGAPRQCEFGTNTSVDAYGQSHEYGRVLTQLPPQWIANQARIVKWAARVVHPNQIEATIKQMVGSLK